MEIVRKRIQKVGKILAVVCTIARVFMFVSMGVALVVMIGALFHDGIMRQAEKFFEQEQILREVSRIYFLKDVQLKYLVLISGLVHIGSRLIFVVYLTFFKVFMGNMAGGENPFTIQNAKKLRRVCYTMIALVFYSFILAVTLFLVLLFVSYLFEYGAYLQDKADETNRIQEEMIVSFAEITENKSEQTGKHVKRVAEYSKLLAVELGMSNEEVSDIYLASTMHDIGKLLIDAAILEKPSRLTEEEYTEIKKHSGYGGQLLDSVEGEVMALAKTIALEHHERIDGKGYPKGKHGDEISLAGKIVAVADVYDALTSKRSYKEPWDHKKAYEEILKGSGTQFDLEVVEAFKRAYGKINTIRQQFADEN